MLYAQQNINTDIITTRGRVPVKALITYVFKLADQRVWCSLFPCINEP